MSEDFFASAEKLEMHRAINVRELELSEELVHSIQRIGSLLQQADDRYRLVLAQASKLRDSFRKTVLFIEDFEGTVFETSRKINDMLKNAGDELSYYLNHNPE